MTSYIFVVIGAVRVNNVVLVRILGLCPFMGVSKKLETAIGMGAATTFVLTVGSGTSYLIDTFLLKPFDREILTKTFGDKAIAGFQETLADLGYRDGSNGNRLRYRLHAGPSAPVDLAISFSVATPDTTAPAVSIGAPAAGAASRRAAA